MLQLLRIPNIFTAIADVWMGLVVTRGELELATAGWLSLVSACLYLAGMVLNDVFDVEQDTRERPNRPIPAGRVTLSSARMLGWGLLGTGVALGWFVAFQFATWIPGIVATLLALCVVLYDAVLKPTPLGPLAMGGCRALNVTLGMSLAMRGLDRHEWMLVAGIGFYIAGLTWFARTEATSSRRRDLILATVTSLAGIAVIGVIAMLPGSIGLQLKPMGWYLLWTVIGMLLMRRYLLAILQPTPRHVQMAVKNGILTIIYIDAGIALGFGELALWGCAILLLIFPTMILGRSISMT